MDELENQHNLTPENQVHFAAAEDVEDLISEIEAAGIIENDIGTQYKALDIVANINRLLSNINAGKYDQDTDNQLFNGDLLTITRAQGIRRAVEESVAHIIVRRQRA